MILTLDCMANIVDKWLQVGVVAGESAVVREMDKLWEAGLRVGMERGGKEKSCFHGRTIVMTLLIFSLMRSFNHATPL